MWVEWLPYWFSLHCYELLCSMPGIPLSFRARVTKRNCLPCPGPGEVRIWTKESFGAGQSKVCPLLSSLSRLLSGAGAATFQFLSPWSISILSAALCIPWVYILRSKNPQDPVPLPAPTLYTSAYTRPGFCEALPSLTPLEHSPGGLSSFVHTGFGLRCVNLEIHLRMRFLVLSSCLLIIFTSPS